MTVVLSRGVRSYLSTTILSEHFVVVNLEMFTQTPNILE